MRDLIIVLISIGILAVVTGSPYVVTFDEADDNTVTVIPQGLENRPLLGRKSCTQGPAYWCYNITQAKQCGAVSHCIKKVWEPMKLPADNDSVCEVCKEMVKEARDQLLSNETQDELRKVLEGSCNLIPLKIISEECCKLADDFIPELVDALASRMDPQVVCAVSGLCNSVRIDEMLGEMKEIDSGRTTTREPFDLNTDSCPKCSHFLGKAVSSLKRLPKEALLTKMLQACGHLGSYSDSCRGIVMQELDTIYNHIQNQMNSVEICGLMGLCEVVSIHPVRIHNSGTSVRVWTPSENDDDLECDFCKQLVIYLKNWFTADTTKEEFHDLIIGMCKQTGKYRQECLNLAKQYGKEIYDFLIQNLDPDEVCSTMGICNNTIQGRVKIFSSAANVGPIWTLLPVDSDTSIPLTKLRPAERLAGDDERKSHQSGFVYPLMKLTPPERLTGDDEANAQNLENQEVCEFCKLLAREAQSYVKTHENVTEEKLEKWVNQFCDAVMRKDQSTRCHDLVDKYGAAFVNAVINDLSPDTICSAIEVCPGVQEIVVREEVVLPAVGVRDILPTCSLCSFTITKLFDLIGRNRSKAAIDGAMDDVCYLVPRSYRDECLTFMKEYGERVAEMILIEGTAHEICAALHLCLFSPAPVKKVGRLVGDSLLSFDRYMPQTMVNDIVNRWAPHKTQEADVDEKPTCALCEFVMTQLDSMLENNSTEQEIKDTVEHICDYIPRTVRTQCRQFVDEYGDLVINYLAQSLEPREICSKLNLCDPIPSVIEDSGDDQAVMDLKLSRCDMCIIISDYLSAFLDDPKVETSVEEMVEKVCPLLPLKHRGECTDIIEDYGPYLISLLAQATDKGKVCQAVNLCPGTA